MMMDEKPNNQEVLGLIVDDTKLDWITNLKKENIKGILRFKYLTERLKRRSALSINDELQLLYKKLKCTIPTKHGNRAEQLVDGVKHIKNENTDETIASSLER